MPFFRPLHKIKPDYDPNLPWPIDGLAYVAAFIGPMSAGGFGGIVTGRGTAAIFGLPLGIGISLLNGPLMDRILEPLIARHQERLAHGIARGFVNTIAFAWAFALSGLAMLAPALLFGVRIP